MRDCLRYLRWLTPAARLPVGCMSAAALVLAAVLAGGCEREAGSTTGTGEMVERAAASPSGAETSTPRLPAARAVPAPTPPGPTRLAEFVEIAEALERSDNEYLGRAQLAVAQQHVGMATNAGERAFAHMELAWHLLRLGLVDQSLAELGKAEAHANRSPAYTAEMEADFLRRRAVFYLRQAEVTNCIERHNRDCCVFPLAGGGVHEDKAAAIEARSSLLRALEIEPDQLDAVWLLNLVSMAIGDYPQGVPEQFRIPPPAFESDYDIKRFVDVAPELGVDTFNLCGGTITDDFNGDGLLDIVTSTSDPRGSLTFYANLGDGAFEDRSAAAGVTPQWGGLNCIGGDYDNDGDVDVLVLRGGWMKEEGRMRNSLLRNNGDATFTDVTAQAGLDRPAMPTQAACWGDFDRDGHLDLYIGNESRRDLAPGGGGDFPAQLFRNNGDGTFTDIAEQAGAPNHRYAKGVTAGDYDNDGDLDIYISNVGPNRLYRNDGSGRFTDVATELGVTEPARRSFATWFFDYDNDGWLDLFVTAYETFTDDLAAEHLGIPHDGDHPRLYRNDGAGGFVDVSVEMNLDHPSLPMGANFGDLDNDGYLDVYLATGDPGYQTLMPNVMLRNDAARAFQNVTTSGGFGHLQKGHGVAFFDFDDDGDQDIYHQLGGFLPGDRFHNALFLNPGHGNHFLTLKLVGTATNRSAYGARLRIVVRTPEGERTIHRAVGSISSFGGSPGRQEIGLGNAMEIVRIEIDWPRSETQTITGVPLDARIRVVEGTAGFERVDS